MNNRILQKNNETQIIKHFINTYSEFPKGKLIPGESPDFIVQINKRKTIGIELTKLYLTGDHSHSPPEEKDLKFQLISNIKDNVLQSLNTEISAFFTFQNDFNVNYKNKELPVQKISDTILNRLNETKFGTFFRIKIRNRDLPEGLKSIRLIYHPDDTSSLWRSCEEKISPKQFHKNVGISIQKKEEKLNIYKKKRHNSLWLLIAADLLKCAVNLNMLNYSENSVFESKYDKILLFDRFEGKVYQLK